MRSRKRKIGHAQYFYLSKSRYNRRPIQATHFASNAGKNAKKRRRGETMQKSCAVVVGAAAPGEGALAQGRRQGARSP